MVLTDTMIAIKKEIETNGVYCITALSTDKERSAIKRMIKCNMIKTIKKTESYIDFGKNWK